MDYEVKTSLCDRKTLKLDQACLEIHSHLNEVITISAQSQECYHCPLWDFGHIQSNETIELRLNTSWPTRLSIGSQNRNLCNFSYHFGEFGLYHINVSEEDQCDLNIIKNPDHWLLSLLYSILFLVTLKLGWMIAVKIYNTRLLRSSWMRFRFQTNELSQQLIINDSSSDDVLRESADVVTTRSPDLMADQHDGTDSVVDNSTEESREIRRVKKRIKSLDVFRGMAISLMIFVNYGGGGYWFFKHARWNGLTFADLVFPWFMWIMGVSLAISMESQFRKAVPKRVLFVNAIRRSVILFMLGIFLNSGKCSNLRHLRVPGVLQRFGLVYLLVNCLELGLTPLASFGIPQRLQAVKDVLPNIFTWVAVLVVVGIHTGITFFLEVPGCPTGYLGPGGLYENASHPQCTGGAAQFVDVQVLGPRHIYQNPTAKIIYDTSVPFDPEGMLGTLTSVLLVYLGVQCGKTLLSFQAWTSRLIRWISWSLILGIAAGFLCGFSKETGWIPINKNLWSLSFVLATGAMSFLLFSVIYLIVDVCPIWNGSPFHFAGLNPIVLYLGHEICHGYLPFAWKPITNGHTELLFMNLWGTLLWILFAYVMYQKKSFISI